MSAKNTSLHCDSVGGGSHNGSLKPAASSRAQRMGDGGLLALPSCLSRDGAGARAPGAQGPCPPDLGGSGSCHTCGRGCHSVPRAHGWCLHRGLNAASRPGNTQRSCLCRVAFPHEARVLSVPVIVIIVENVTGADHVVKPSRPRLARPLSKADFCLVLKQKPDTTRFPSMWLLVPDRTVTGVPPAGPRALACPLSRSRGSSVRCCAAGWAPGPHLS